MIKRLRVKFVCVIMAIVMVLLGGILGVVIYFTGENMEMQSINMMRSVADHPFQQENLGTSSDAGVRLPYFVLQISNRGELLASSGGYFDLSDREYLQEIINRVLRSKGETGKLGEYDLRYLKSSSPLGLTIVFSDTTAEEMTMHNMVWSCIVVFLVAMLAFFGISIVLSGWVIKPVEAAWEQQRQFVSDASHELKTPLSVIMAKAELMSSRETGEEERLQYSANILNVAYQMRALVENMLEMARVDDGAGKIRFSGLDLSQLVRDAVLSFQLLYEEKEMGLVCSVREDIRIQGSEQHLYQVLDVLLDNALKYAADRSTVRVELTAGSRSCLLSVASMGEPISGEDLKNIFKRFYRADKARAMNGSYGLGLAIAESIVRAHKGKIWAQSENGCNTFFVQLPME